MTDEKWEEKRPTIEGLREMGETFLSMYAINLCDLTLKLEKALDKACEELERNWDGYHPDRAYMMHWKMDEWKEWCMRDD